MFSKIFFIGITAIYKTGQMIPGIKRESSTSIIVISLYYIVCDLLNKSKKIFLNTVESFCNYIEHPISGTFIGSKEIHSDTLH